MAKEFCGCCGGEMETQTQIWCSRCEGHVKRDLQFWEATWYAQTGKYCPFTTCQFVPHSKEELRKRGVVVTIRKTAGEPMRPPKVDPRDVLFP